MGFFSWRCAKSGKSISNAYSTRGAEPCALVTPEGVIEEHNYDGYGEFGGIDAYAWLAYANGLVPEIKSLEELKNSDQDAIRGKGIDLFFSDEKPEDYKPIKIVALSEYDGEPYWALAASEDCPWQGYFYDEEDEEN